jgi:hypothetical protein
MSSEILIFGLDDSTAEGDDDRVFGLQKMTFARNAVSTDKIKEHLEKFIGSMRDIITAVPRAMADYEVSEVTFTVQVSAKGSVSLLGMGGGEISGGGGIEIKLQRKSEDRTPKT